jgi:MerR family copper efflux transcriptional regulator
MPWKMYQEGSMENTTSYSIAEAAALLNLSAKTIRRYIKSGKLPSVKVPTKFGDEYRITEIPEELRQEAAAQAEVRASVDIVPSEETNTKLDAQLLYQENIRMAAQLGAATERIRQLEEQLKQQENQLAPTQERVRQLEGQLKLLEALENQLRLLEAPKEQPRQPWWKRLFGAKQSSAA